VPEIVQVQQDCTYPAARHLSVASDGIRVSTEDTVYFVINSKFDDAITAAWGVRVTWLRLGLLDSLCRENDQLGL
jgi:hypothetical protein